MKSHASPSSFSALPTVKPQRWGRIVLATAALIVLIAAVFDTKIVRIGSADDERKAVFSPETFGSTEFPKIKADITARAVDARELYQAISANKQEAATKYGVANSSGPLFSVRLTGIAGEGSSGVYKLAVEGLPAEVTVRLQTGPAINGTELRDATGKIEFGQFTNQIEYQNAGSALNNAMKKSVLSIVDTSTLSGKTLAVTGAFRLINPNNWLITPVQLEVK